MPSELSQTDSKDHINKSHSLFSQIYSTEMLSFMTYHKQCCGPMLCRALDADPVSF